MRRSILYLLLALFCLSAVAAADSAKPSYPVYRMDKAPVVDGDVSGDPAWSGLPWGTGFRVLGGKRPAKKQTRFAMGYTSDALYIAVFCDEPDVDKVKAIAGDDDEGIWAEDGVEVFIYPVSGNALQVVVNLNGAHTNYLHKPGSEFESHASVAYAQTAVRKGDGSYTVEVKMPFKTLGRTPKAGQTWSGAVCRNVHVGDERTEINSTWAPVLSMYYEPENFAELRFEGRPPTDSQKDIPSISTEESDAELNLVVSLGFDEGGGDIAHGTSAIINDGKVFGAVSVKGENGFALRFDKDGDRVEVPDSPSLSSITTAMTLECRAYFDLDKLSGKSGTLIAKSPLSGFGNGFYLFFSDTRGVTKAIEFGVAQDWQVREGCQVDNAITASGWHHIIVTFDVAAADGKAAKIYVDGQLMGAYPLRVTSMAINQPPLTIGGQQVSWEEINKWSNTFLGDIDEVKVWSKALSFAEIERLYGSTWAKSKPISPKNAAETATQPTFSWTKSTDGTSYIFELSMVPSFTAKTTIRKPLTMSTFKPAQALKPGVWYWRVWSTDKAGKPTAACETRAVVVAWKDKFMPADTTPPVITDVKPVPDAGNEVPRPALSGVWSDDSALDLKSAKVLLDGKDIAKGATITETGFICTPTSDLANGMHKLAITIKDKAGNVSNLVKQSFSVGEPCKADVRIGKDRLIYTNGEPWFPMMGYGMGVLGFDNIARAGFNSMYGGLGPIPGNDYALKSFRAAGLRYYADMSQFTGRGKMEGGTDFTYKSVLQVMPFLNALPDYFAVCLDEPNGMAEGIQYARAIWKAMNDTGHGKPVMWILNSPSASGAYGEVGDGVCIDCYPVPTRPMDTVAKFIDFSHELLARKKPVWFIVQALDWRLEASQYKPVPSDKSVQQVLDELKAQNFEFRPNAREIRCMSYLALAHDVQGLMIYPNPSGGQYIGITYFPDALKGLLDTASQVRWLSPILLSQQGTALVTAEPKDSGLHIFSKPYNGAIYLIAVNPTELPISATFKLPGKAGKKVDSVFENRTLKLSGMTFSDLFRPGDARVYRVSF